MINLNKQRLNSSIGQGLSEESRDQSKEANQANMSKRSVPIFFEFWENVAAATPSYSLFGLRKVKLVLQVSWSKRSKRKG